MDYIHIRDLELDCIVGILPFERKRRRKVVVNLRLGCDLRPAGSSDSIGDTVDYSAIRDSVVAVVSRSADGLIERLAERIAQVALGYELVREVRVTLDKPGAVEGTRSVAVEIFRSKRDRVRQ